VADPTKRVCGKCPQNGPQPLENFPKKRTGRGRTCNACRRIYSREHYSRNRKSYTDRVRRKQNEIREWMANYKAGLKCERCPEAHPACLTFHHRDPTTKEFTLGAAVLYTLHRVQAEIAKCAVLCFNCHYKLHYYEKNGAD